MAEEKVEKGNFKLQLKVKDLKKVHERYSANVKEWRFTMALYEGIRAVIRAGLVKQHEREPDLTYERRIKELYGFGYTKSVVEIFQHHLFKKSPQGRKLDTLQDDEVWKMYVKDADLYGNDYESTMMELALYAGVEGHMGVLIDKASIEEGASRQQQIEKRVHPYIAKFYPPAILDWVFSRDEYNRPYLSFLKLLDDSQTNNQYIFWSPESWEVWELPKDDDGKDDDSNVEQDAVFIKANVNPIGEIPFVWHYNFKTRHVGIGSGDVHEVARIDLSIIRNLSQIEQIINFAAFPMMRKPMRDASPTEISAPQQDDEVGSEVILEFDPEHPESKPDWLEAKVKEPVEATWQVIIGKVAELYRAANIGGMASTEPTKAPQSGVAKRVDFQLLASKLVSKAINLENTENKMLEFWLKWEQMWDKYKDKVKMSRSKDFDIEDLATDLDNALTAQTVVMSKKFKELVQKQTARAALPSATEKELQQIDEEIEKAIETGPAEDTVEKDSKFSQEDKGIIDSGGKANEIITDETDEGGGEGGEQ
jgi:hypothetical protein